MVKYTFGSPSCLDKGDIGVDMIYLALSVVPGNVSFALQNNILFVLLAYSIPVSDGADAV